MNLKNLKINLITKLLINIYYMIYKFNEYKSFNKVTLDFIDNKISENGEIYEEN